MKCFAQTVQAYRADWRFALFVDTKTWEWCCSLPCDAPSPLYIFVEKHRGFGFLEYEEPDDAAAAIDNMDRSELGGRIIHVNQAKPVKFTDKNRPGASFILFSVSVKLFLSKRKTVGQNITACDSDAIELTHMVCRVRCKPNFHLVFWNSCVHGGASDIVDRKRCVCRVTTLTLMEMYSWP